MTLPNHYAALGVTRLSAPAQVRAAFYARIRGQHPDQQAGRITDRFAAAQTAYNVLRSPRAAEEYLARLRLLPTCRGCGGTGQATAAVAPCKACAGAGVTFI